jgi:hypothetical protein
LPSDEVDHPIPTLAADLLAAETAGVGEIGSQLALCDLGLPVVEEGVRAGEAFSAALRLPRQL